MKAGRENRFAVDENGFTADGYRRLEPESRKSMYLGSVIAMVIAVGMLVAAGHYSDEITGGDGGTFRIATYLLAAAVVVYCLVKPEVLYRRYRYRMDDDKIEVRKGVVYIVHEMVPVERVHQVDIREGPINRMFGLADVVITTAGGVVTIEYLKADVAQGIATKLNDKVVSILKERV